MTPADPTQRFSDRVVAYVQARPSYPEELLTSLTEFAGLRAEAVVADIGSGTGIFTELLLPRCDRVYAVEPNAPMRAAAEERLASHPRFTSVSGTAEATGLPDGAVDLITVAQAFHWFDVPATRQEFRRILRPGGQVALIWNDRQIDTTPFLAGYETLLRTHGTDYTAVSHAHVDHARLSAFFGDGGYVTQTFPHAHSVTYEGLEARLLSSSYAPNAGHPGHAPMLQALRELFDRHQVDGRVTFLYDTRVHFARL